MGLDASRSSRAPVLLLTVKVRVKLPAVAHTTVLCPAGDSCTPTIGWDAGVTVVDPTAEPLQEPDLADAVRETVKPGQTSTPCARLHVTATSESGGTAGRQAQDRTGHDTTGHIRHYQSGGRRPSFPSCPACILLLPDAACMTLAS